MRPRLLPGLPLVAAFVLAATSGLPQMGTPVELAWSVLGTAILLAGWSLWLYDHALRRGRTLRLVVNLRAQHYVQAGAQTTVLVYWGFYWPVVPESLLLVTAQLVFAYAFDMLLGWSRRDTYALGFGPLPVVLSTSLFLWFKAEWFYLQFLLIAVGFLAKELIQWKKAGRRVHVFNPSALPLALFSVVLIATGTTDMTWGAEIAATLNNAPWIYVVIVLAAFPGQALFGGTPMTLSAAVTMYLFGLLHFASTGTYFFVDSYIPIAVFLGMHLLFTDPSTSPQSERGRLVFGALYALSVVGLYAVLARLGVPTFYDKLLAVPLLNLMVTVIDCVTEDDIRVDLLGEHVRDGKARRRDRRRRHRGGEVRPVDRGGAHERTAAARVCRRLGRRVRRHDGRSRGGRYPSWSMGDVLVGRLPSGSDGRLFSGGASPVGLLCQPVGMGLQRVRYLAPARPPTGVGGPRVSACV